MLVHIPFIITEIKCWRTRVCLMRLLNYMPLNVKSALPPSGHQSHLQNRLYKVLIVNVKDNKN